MAHIKTFSELNFTSLNGKNFEYTYKGSGMHGEVTFDDKNANWVILAGENKGMSGSDPYKAMTVSAGIFFVMWHESTNNITVVLTINENSEAVFASVVSPEEVEFDVAEFNIN